MCAIELRLLMETFIVWNKHQPSPPKAPAHPVALVQLVPLVRYSYRPGSALVLEMRPRM